MKLLFEGQRIHAIDVTRNQYHTHNGHITSIQWRYTLHGSTSSGGQFHVTDTMSNARQPGTISILVIRSHDRYRAKLQLFTALETKPGAIRLEGNHFPLFHKTLVYTNQQSSWSFYISCYIGIDLDLSKPKGMPLGLKLHTYSFTTKYINMAKA